MYKLLTFSFFVLICFNALCQYKSKEDRMIDSLQNVINQLKILEAERQIQEIKYRLNQTENTTEEVISNPVNEPASTLSGSVKFSEEQLKKFEQRAKEMIDDLMFQINIVSYKKNTNEIKMPL